MHPREIAGLAFPRRKTSGRSTSQPGSGQNREYCFFLQSPDAGSQEMQKPLGSAPFHLNMTVPKAVHSRLEVPKRIAIHTGRTTPPAQRRDEKILLHLPVQRR